MTTSYQIEKILGHWTITRYVYLEFSFHKDTAVIDADCDDVFSAFKAAMDCFKSRPIRECGF